MIPDLLWPFLCLGLYLLLVAIVLAAHRRLDRGRPVLIPPPYPPPVPTPVRRDSDENWLAVWPQDVPVDRPSLPLSWAERDLFEDIVSGEFA